MLEKASKEELIAGLKKQRQTALRYKARFSEVCEGGRLGEEREGGGGEREGGR